jgi:hypothetical protein
VFKKLFPYNKLNTNLYNFPNTSTIVAATPKIMRRGDILCIEGIRNVLWKLSDIIWRQESTLVMQIEMRDCCINCIIKTCGGIWEWINASQNKAPWRVLMKHEWRLCSIKNGNFFWLLFYALFWVIPRRLNFICGRFGTLCLFHLHRQVGVEWIIWELLGYPYGRRFGSKIVWANRKYGDGVEGGSGYRAGSEG